MISWLVNAPAAADVVVVHAANIAHIMAPVTTVIIIPLITAPIAAAAATGVC